MNSEDLYYILVDKTASEAKLKVDAVEAGEGIMAFQNLYLWFSGTSGEAISWKTAKVMNPTPVKKEEDLASALDQWLKDVKTLKIMETVTTYHHLSEFKPCEPS